MHNIEARRAAPEHRWPSTWTLDKEYSRRLKLPHRRPLCLGIRGRLPCSCLHTAATKDHSPRQSGDSASHGLPERPLGALVPRVGARLVAACDCQREDGFPSPSALCARRPRRVRAPHESPSAPCACRSRRPPCVLRPHV